MGAQFLDARRRLLAMQLQQVETDAAQYLVEQPVVGIDEQSDALDPLRHLVKQLGGLIGAHRTRALGEDHADEVGAAFHRRGHRAWIVQPADLDLDFAHRSSATMARAAVAGLAAPVIGRPMTSTSAPAAKASLGVITRR